MFSLVLFLTASAVANAKLPRFEKGRSLTPKDAGAYHTDAFEMLGELYRNKKPRDLSEVMEDMNGILVGYCPLEFHECESYVDQTMKEKHAVVSSGRALEITYPSDFDPAVKESIDNIVFTIENINESNLDDVLDALTDIESEMTEMTDIKKVHQIVGLTGASIAIESTKLWHTVFHDTEHPLNGLMNLNNSNDSNRRSRNMQENLMETLLTTAASQITPDIVIADLVAGVQAMLMFVFEDGLGAQDALFESAIAVATAPSISASLSSFLSGASYYDDYYNDYYDDDNAGGGLPIALFCSLSPIQIGC